MTSTLIFAASVLILAVFNKKLIRKTHKNRRKINCSELSSKEAWRTKKMNTTLEIHCTLQSKITTWALNHLFHLKAQSGRNTLQS